MYVSTIHHEICLLVILFVALQMSDTDAVQRCLQPALDAVKANLHKTVHWDTQHAPVPNESPNHKHLQHHHSTASMQHDNPMPQPSPCTSTSHDTECDDEPSLESSSPTKPRGKNHQQQHCIASPHQRQRQQRHYHTRSCDTSHISITGSQEQQHLEQPPSMLLDCSSSCPLFLARFCCAWVYTGMATIGVSLLEKQRDYQAAIDLIQLLLGGNCCPGRRGEWWCRLSINLEHLGDVDAALEVSTYVAFFKSGGCKKGTLPFSM